MKLPAPSKAFSRTLLDAHSLLGLIFGAAVYLVCASGTLAVLSNEFALWEAASAPRVERASPEMLARIAAAAYAEAKKAHADHDLYVNAPTPELPWVTVYASGENFVANHRAWSADATGKLIPAPATPWTDFMREHHHDLHLPDPFGAYVVGIIGTLLLASLGSGVIAHRRILKDAFRLRWGGSPRLGYADLHNRVGVWALPFHLIVSLTGSLLGLAGLIIMILALVAYKGDQEKAIAALLGPTPAADTRSAPLPDILPMARQIEARTPHAEISGIVFQHVGTRGQTVSLTTAEPGHLARNEGWTFSGDGGFLAKAGFTDGTVGMRVYGMVTPLHYGTYGGLPLKLIYVVLGGGLTAIVATGLSIWFARRRDQGRASPAGEKLWAALVWSQFPAFALSALTVHLGEGWALPTFWLTIVASLGAALAMPNGRAVAMVQKLAGGVLIAGVAVLHLLGQPWTSMGLVIDAGLLATSVALIGFALPSGRRAA